MLKKIIQYVYKHNRKMTNCSYMVVLDCICIHVSIFYMNKSDMRDNLFPCIECN